MVFMAYESFNPLTAVFPPLLPRLCGAPTDEGLPCLSLRNDTFSLRHACVIVATHHLPISPCLHSLPRQPTPLNLLPRHPPPLLNRQPLNPRPIPKPPKPIDVLHDEAHVLRGMDIVPRLPQRRVRMRAHETRGHEVPRQVPGGDGFEVAVQAETWECGGGVRGGDVVVVFFAVLYGEGVDVVVVRDDVG